MFDDGPSLTPFEVFEQLLHRYPLAEIPQATGAFKQIVRMHARNVRGNDQLREQSEREIERIVETRTDLSEQERAELVRELTHTFRVWVRGKPRRE